jgi:ParB/RepB/Spo0J family partition protein
MFSSTWWVKMHPNDQKLLANVRAIDKIAEDPSFPELCLSIKAQGVLEPISYYVENGSNIVLHGHRRVLAARVVEAENIPAHRVKKPTETERILQQLVTGVQREDLNHMDIALGCAELINKLGMTNEQVAERFGYGPSWVSQHIGLLRLVPELQEKVRLGSMVYRAGYELSTLEENDQKKWKDQLAQVTTVRNAKQAKRGILQAKQIDKPQLVQTIDVEPEADEVVQGEQPDETLMCCLRLIEMARDDIESAKTIAEEHELDISVAIEKLRKEI